VDKKGATGKAIVHKYPKLEDRLVWQFVEAFYKEVFLEYAEGERSLLNSRLNRFKGGCEEAFSMYMQARRNPPEQQTEDVPVE